MAITAKFLADFSDFETGVKGAGHQLDLFETGSKKAAGAVTEMQRAATVVTPSITGLHDSLADVDHVLAAMGIHIVPEVRALAQLGDAAGQTVGQLGAVSTAGLALGAALGGWKIGRLIADFTGSDEVIGAATASLFGWNTESQVAGARQDILTRATHLAGREITDMSEALFINEGALRKVREATAKHTVELEKLTIAAHTQAVQSFDAAAIDINNQAKLAQLADDITAKHRTEAAAYIKALEAKNAKADEATAAAQRMGDAFVKAETDAADAAKLHNEELKNEKKLADEAAAANRAMGGSFEITRENFAASARGLGGNADAVELLLKRGYSFEQALLYSKHPEWPEPQDKGPRVPGFAGGVENFGGGPAWVGERGPELLNLPRGSSITPEDSASRDATTIIQLVVDGRVLASVVNEHNMRSMMQGRKLAAA